MPKRPDASRFFVPDTLLYLRELARHNDRAWFEENKPRYVSSVQDPAVRFIASMGPRLAGISPHIEADARPFGGSLSRIYRDVRFSKDKSPYRTNVGVHFSYARPAQGESLPGFFLHIDPGQSFVASGIWHPVPQQLRRIRDAIVASPEDWQRVVGAGLTLGGESYVRVPAGYDPKHRHASDLRRKDFYASLPFEDDAVTAPTFPDAFESACRTLDPLNRFLAGALGLPW